MGFPMAVFRVRYPPSMSFQVAISSSRRCRSAVSRFSRVVRSGHSSSSDPVTGRRRRPPRSCAVFVRCENPLSTSKSSPAVSGVRFPFFSVPRVYIVIRVCTVFVLAGGPKAVRNTTPIPVESPSSVRGIRFQLWRTGNGRARNVALRVDSFRRLHDTVSRPCIRSGREPILFIYVFQHTDI